MARPRTSENKPYGRQKKGKTIKSVSLEDDIARKAELEAERRGISFSEFVNGLLKGTIKLPLIAALLASALWFAAPDSRPALRSAGKALASLAKSAAAQVAKL